MILPLMIQYFPNWKMPDCHFSDGDAVLYQPKHLQRRHDLRRTESPTSRLRITIFDIDCMMRIILPIRMPTLKLYWNSNCRHGRSGMVSKSHSEQQDENIREMRHINVKSAMKLFMNVSNSKYIIGFILKYSETSCTLVTRGPNFVISLSPTMTNCGKLNEWMNEWWIEHL